MKRKKLVTNTNKSIDEMYGEFELFKKSISNQTNIKKGSLSNEISTFGSEYLIEIDKKNKKKENIRQRNIKYIIKYSKNKYKKNKLNDQSFEEIKSIYTKVRANKHWYIRIIDFIMNWDENKKQNNNRR